ncbi:UNVERIFIED_CONTAM: cytochrome, seed isoform [Sesamum angustifolium]|uniref:Cytochrome, seed isoform n=1 Tax=Sesamum angustifolium TaxID=2727405 RepID=A0AAW2NZ62_9LAMI
MGAESNVFTHSQVSAHNTSEDCWVIINAKVYNVTNYLNDHPGGDEVLLAAAGKDASEEFEDVGHGSAARLMLDEFYVGEIDPSINLATKIEDTTLGPIKDVKDKPLESTNKLLYFVLALIIIVFGLGIHFFDVLT